MTDQRYLPPLAALKAFEAVGRLGGLRPAGRELSIDHAVIGRHIRSLETWVGVALVIRDGRSYALTEKGAIYHAQITSALADIISATGKLIQQGELELRFWCVPGFAALWMSDRLHHFVRANPDIAVNLRPSDSAPDFRSKDVDCDIRYLRPWEEDSVPACVRVHEFARPNVFPVASPELLHSLPPIEHAADFLKCPLLHDESDLEWRHWLAEQDVAAPATLGGTRCWHAHLTVNAARNGYGIALANQYLVGDDLRSGKLVIIQPTGSAFRPVRFARYALLAREDRWNIPPLARFRKWLRTMIEDEPVFPTEESGASMAPVLTSLASPIGKQSQPLMHALRG